MKGFNVLNRLHKDLVIPMSKEIHRLNYKKVINQMNEFIKEYWHDDENCYRTKMYTMYMYRNLLSINDIQNRFSNLNLIYNINEMKCRYTGKRIPKRYVYTMTR